MITIATNNNNKTCKGKQKKLRKNKRDSNENGQKLATTIFYWKHTNKQSNNLNLA
jgi:hypothetical protein